MVRAPCCEKVGLKKGRWTAEEDEILRKYVEANGEGSWKSLPKNAGLKRCGKSCRLRWVNYLRGDLKKENFTSEEDAIIVKMHNTLGSRWSLMASNLPGRTDNDIKNYWNSHLRRSVHTFRRPFGEYPTTIAIDIIKMRPSKRKGRTSRAAMKKKSYIMKDPHKIPANAVKMSVCELIPSVQIQEATLKNGKEENEQNRFIQGLDLESSCMLFAENIMGSSSKKGDSRGIISSSSNGATESASDQWYSPTCSITSCFEDEWVNLESCMLFAENIMGSSNKEGESGGIISSSSNGAAESTSDQWYSSACSITSCFEDDWVNLIIEDPNNNNDEQEFLYCLWDHEQ